nr:dynein intermediate chain 3, axonemal-like [Lepeophtheirus salmonis]
MGASHSFMIEDLKWFPSDVRFHSDSAYPRKNDDESVRQFLTCSSGDAFILVWGFEIPPSDNTNIDSLAPDIGQPDGLQSQGILHQSSNWNKVKEHHGFMDYNSESSSNTKKVGVGKYQFLNEIWKPVHKISFLLPQSEKITDEIQYFRVQITSVSVISRPDLMLKSEKQQQKKSTGDDESDLSDVDDEDMGNNSRSNRKSRRSMDHNFFAIPIDFIGGTFLGKCKIKWNRSTHDGPTKCIERSPFNSDVILTMGGYSLAIWKDNVIEKPVILHFVDYEEEFTQAVWSLTRPAVYFLSGNLGNFQAWLIMSRQSAPFFKQNISGKSITSLCPYEIQTSGKHLMTIGDSTGTLRILSLPRELWETESNEIEEFEKYITREIELVREKDRKISENSFESMITSSRKKNQQQDEEEEASHSAWSDVNKFWSDYFEVEKGYLLDKYGQISWTSHANKNPRYPRSQYLSEFEDTDVIDKKTVKVASSALDAFKKTAAK